MKEIKIAAFILITLFGCEKENEEITPAELPTALTLNIHADFYTAGDNWALIHDLTGQLIDYRTFDSGDTLIFDKTDKFTSDKFNVTFLQAHQKDGSGEFYLKSYMAIEAGQEWTLNNSQGDDYTQPIEKGNFTVNLTDVLASNVYAKSLTSKSGKWSRWDSNTVASPVIYEGDSIFILTIDTEVSGPKYKIIENPKDQDVFNVSALNDMLEFDKVVNVSFPPTSDIMLYVRGFELNQSMYMGYVLYKNWLMTYTKPVRSSISIGYLNMFERNNTWLSVAYNDISYHYYNQETIPESIDFPFDKKFEVLDKSINNFSYTNTHPFYMRETVYSYNDSKGNSIEWYVNAPASEAKINELPDEFLNTYPDFKMDILNHSYTNFNLSQNTSYSNFIDAEFKGVESDADTEYYEISIK